MKSIIKFRKVTLWFKVASITCSLFVIFPSCQKEELVQDYIPAMDELLFTSSPMKDKSNMVKDVDGNWYNTVTIGTHVWMAENLKTTRFNDKTKIPLVSDGDAWAELSTPGYCWYDNDKKNGNTYGALYNWYTVANGNLCPEGWHVPAYTEWLTLVNYLGGTDVAGGKLKEAGTTHWTSPNVDADNSSGFTGLPGGSRGISDFSSLGTFGFWWSQTKFDQFDAHGMHLWYDSGWSYLNEYNFISGRSVRCVKD